MKLIVKSDIKVIHLAKLYGGLLWVVYQSEDMFSYWLLEFNNSSINLCSSSTGCLSRLVVRFSFELYAELRSCY